jgi:CRP-like cAMP-binding protein
VAPEEAHPGESAAVLPRFTRGSYHQTALNVFITSLSFNEFTALVNQMTRIRAAAGKTIRKIGDQQTALYLIVTGNLKATSLMPMSETQEVPTKNSIYLSGNDFFGDIYPYDAEKISQAFVETITAAELVKIPKSKLSTRLFGIIQFTFYPAVLLFGHHPNIHHQLAYSGFA